MTTEGLDRAAEWIARAERVVVSTGAGMSRESGIPTFRDAMEGLWAQYDPQELATEAGFRANPRRVWSWYAHRRRQIEKCEPHAGHYALAEMAPLVPHLTLGTQNVDGLHARAGSPDVIELHGNITRAKCLDHGHPFAGPLSSEAEDEDPPPCPVCGSPLRPDVVWFGEMLPEGGLERARAESERCGVILVVGTSGTVWPAAELPYVAQAAGARIVEINPEPSEVTAAADLFVQAPAGVALPALLARLREARDG
ncbi:MAG TPA: NAD-dependent deacylase [Longimicrobiaceae bacterium]|jgi:NAD-dependent deacetylase|nr:NAD-dependent deacylase [Longimicrobiaceae bacterium]